MLIYILSISLAGCLKEHADLIPENNLCPISCICSILNYKQFSSIGTFDLFLCFCHVFIFTPEHSGIRGAQNAARINIVMWMSHSKQSGILPCLME